MDLTIKFKTNPEKFNELYQTLQALLPTMRREDGCLECRIYRDVEDGGIFFLSTRWEDSSKIKSYMRSVNGSAFLGAVDMLSNSVSTTLAGDSPQDGIEVLKQMRKGTQ